FLLVPDEVRDPDRGLRLVVPGAAPVEIAVLLQQREGIDAPVFALRFDHVEVREEQERLGLPRPAITHDDVGLVRRRSRDHDVLAREAGVEEALRHRLRRGSGLARAVARVGGDELGVDGPDELASRLGRDGLRRIRRGGGDGGRGQDEAGHEEHERHSDTPRLTAMSGRPKFAGSWAAPPSSAPRSTGTGSFASAKAGSTSCAASSRKSWPARGRARPSPICGRRSLSSSTTAPAWRSGTSPPSAAHRWSRWKWDATASPRPAGPALPWSPSCRRSRAP